MSTFAVRAHTLRVVVAEGSISVAVMREGPFETVAAQIFFSGFVDSGGNCIKKLWHAHVGIVFLQASENSTPIVGQMRTDIDFRAGKSTDRVKENSQNSQDCQEFLYVYF